MPPRPVDPARLGPASPALHRARIDRTIVPLPDDARAALTVAGTPGPAAYRTAGTASPDLDALRWYRVASHAPAVGPRALFWPTMRTALPASASVALALSLLGAAASLGTLGVVGVVLGSAVSGLVARTQYDLERTQHALAAIYLSTDGAWVLVGRYPSLDARVRDRPHWHLHATESLDFPALPAAGDRLVVHQRSWSRVMHALTVIGLDPAALDPWETARLHTLVRLGHRRRVLRGAGANAGVRR